MVSSIGSCLARNVLLSGSLLGKGWPMNQSDTRTFHYALRIEDSHLSSDYSEIHNSGETALVSGIYAAEHRALNGNFFFSSRRRHTRLQGDWSSDVCSSD